jgi:hypothetical protein
MHPRSQRVPRLWPAPLAPRRKAPGAGDHHGQHAPLCKAIRTERTTSAMGCPDIRTVLISHFTIKLVPAPSCSSSVSSPGFR